MGSSRARPRTRVPCVGRQVLNHCTTREALMWTISKVFIELATTLPLFYVLALRPRGMWDPSSPTRYPTPHPLHWKAKSQPLDRQGSPLVPVFNSFKYTRRSGTAGSHGNSKLYFLRKCQIVFPQRLNHFALSSAI